MNPPLCLVTTGEDYANNHSPAHSKTTFELAVEGNGRHAEKCITRRKVNTRNLDAAKTNNVSHKKSNGEVAFAAEPGKSSLHHHNPMSILPIVRSEQNILKTERKLVKK